MSVRERKPKNVKFGLSKDDSCELDESSFADEDGRSFSAARDYWQHMCRTSSPNSSARDVSIICTPDTIHSEYTSGVSSKNVT